MSDKENKNLPVIAIVGRPNVGKSSIFNALIGRRLSIVHEMSGVTRDRVVAPASFNGRHFTLVDTGGLGLLRGEKVRKKDLDGKINWDEAITAQTNVALESADVLICVGNAQEGVTVLDEEVAKQVRVSGKKAVYAVNKSDNKQLVLDSAEFARLGFAHVIPVSCEHNYRINDLIECALSLLPEDRENNSATDEDKSGASDSGDGEAAAEKPFSIALIGRPNVGKSSLVNALLGEERVIVSDVAGTTRDAVDVDFAIRYRDGMTKAVLVDTAGIRKQTKVDTVVEYFSSMRSQSAIRRADLVLFLVEASGDGVTSQDKKIASMIAEAGKAAIIVANKVDLSTPEETRKVMLDEIRRTLPGLAYAPVCFVSALKKSGLGELLDGIAQLREQMDVAISTSVLNKILSDAVERYTPPVVGNAPLKFYYASQTGKMPPSFLLFVNRVEYCAPNYLSYLEKMLRSAFDLTGFPIRLELRPRPKKVESFHSPERSFQSKRPRKPSRSSGSSSSAGKTGRSDGRKKK